MKKIILKSISNLLFILVIVIALLLVGVKLIGLQSYVVISGSMEPKIKVGSIVYVDEVKPEELKKKDIITYQLSKDTLSTHRIVDIIETDGTVKYQTKGDANEDADPKLVDYSNIKGKVILSIPYIGYLANYMQSSKGKVISICIGIIVIVLVFLLDYLAKDEETPKEEKEQPKKEKISKEEKEQPKKEKKTKKEKNTKKTTK